MPLPTNLLWYRCFLNSACQFIAGIPHIQEGLHSPFEAAGLQSNPRVKGLWKDSLASAVSQVVSRILVHGNDAGVADLADFARSCVAIDGLDVLWEKGDSGSERYIMLSSVAAQFIRSSFMLAMQSCSLAL